MVTVGIDEVGRGCWAGPLVAAAVMLPTDFNLEDCPLEIKDSKTLSVKKRQMAAKWVHENAVAVGIGWVWPADIDRLGITTAVKRAMEQALTGVEVAYDEVIIDGNHNFLAENPLARPVVKADGSVPCVSAASIVAKVARDEYMANLDARYAGYGFEQHVGYGTAAHIAALKLLGVSDIHRRSYKPIQALLGLSVS